MAKVSITDGMSAVNVRTNINAMFTSLFTYGFFTEVVARSSGTPSSGDPASFDSISHTISGYTAAPKVILIPKSDWHVYISSVNATTIVVGIGAYGSGVTVDYDLLVTSTDV